MLLLLLLLLAASEGFIGQSRLCACQVYNYCAISHSSAASSGHEAAATPPRRNDPVAIMMVVQERKEQAAHQRIIRRHVCTQIGTAKRTNGAHDKRSQIQFVRSCAHKFWPSLRCAVRRNASARVHNCALERKCCVQCNPFIESRPLASSLARSFGPSASLLVVCK